MFKIFAPAKINLSLHVTGKRPDGYHLLDSLVVFAQNVGDRVTLDPGGQGIAVTGPFAGSVPTDGRDSLTRAKALLEQVTGRSLPCGIHLEKHLPAGAGIGGGSADAAAVLKGLNKLYGLGFSIAELADMSLPLGADVPVCIYGKAARMQGIGEVVTPVTLPAPLHAVLVNPGVHVDTGAVFKALTPILSQGERGRIHHARHPQPVAIAKGCGSHGGLIPAPLSIPHKTPIPCRDEDDDMMEAMASPPLPLGEGWGEGLWDFPTSGNDLEQPAITLAPVIADVLEALRQAPNCTFARMSGSGSTCFGLFPDKAAAQVVARHLGGAHPNWWVQATTLL